MANPVFLKEFRTRLRSKKVRTIQLAIGIPAALLILVSYARLMMALFALKHENGEIWLVCAMLQLALISFLTPGLLANAITQEKEQRTWGLLLITRLSSWQILSGKLIARLIPIPILMVLFVPFMAYSAVASHMGWVTMAGTYGILFSTMLLFAVQALFWSWLFKRTSAAVAASYGFVFLLTLATFIVNSVIEALTHGRWYESMILWINPFFVQSRLHDWIYSSYTPDLAEPTVFLCSIYVAVSLIVLVIMKGSLERARTD